MPFAGTAQQPHLVLMIEHLLISTTSSSIDPAYQTYGGIFREEAILLLRKFYVQENDKGRSNPVHMFIYFLLIESLLAPEPHKKANRELKTDILPLITDDKPKD